MAKYDFPIKYFEDNLIFESSSNDCWAGYQIEGLGYDYLSGDKKISLLNAVARFVANIGKEAKIYIIPIRQDVKEHYNKIIKELDVNDDLYNIALNHAEGTLAYLEERQKIDGAGVDYQIFVFTKLQIPKKPLKFKTAAKDIIRAVNEFFEVDFKEIRQSEINIFNKLSENYYNAQRSRLPLNRINEETIQWLIRRCFRRGTQGDINIRTKDGERPWTPFHEVSVKDGQKTIRPEKRDILTLTGNVDCEERYLKVTDGTGKVSYQTFLSISHIPDGIAIPGGEWLYMLQDWPIASEICITISSIEFRESRRKLENKTREITSQIEHVAQSDAIPDDLRQAYQEVAQLERELAPASDPLARASLTICIAADNLNEMEDNARFVKERYEDMTFEVQRSIADQYAYFMEFLPGTGRYVTDYVLPIPPKTIAGSMFPVTNSLGDKTEGHYVGTFGILKKQVFLDISIACRVNRSASVYISGTLGGGKSYLANLLVLLHVLNGAKSLVIDPKGDRVKWKELLPGLSDQMSITTLTASEFDRGKLDPFMIFSDNVEEACELAKNIICDLFNLDPVSDEYTVIGEALEKIKTVPNPCMESLLEILGGFPADDEYELIAAKLKRRLNAIKNLGMAKLLFSDGTSEGLDFNKRINILSIQNLNLPKPNIPKTDFNETERISMVLMIPIAAFAKKFALSDRSIFKMIAFDESWALKNTTSGQGLFDFMSRMGRALNSSAIFLGHSVKDQDAKGVKEALTYKFCFKVEDRDEAKDALEFIGLEATDENIRTIMNLNNGHCIFRDLYGQIGELEIDAVWEDFHNAFNTNPTETKLT